MSTDEKQKQCSNKSLKTKNKHYKKKHENVACYKYGVKGHMLYNYVYIKHDSSLFKRIWVPKDFHVLTNHKRPVKVWVSRFSK